MKAKDQVIALLPKLTPQELGDVVIAAKVLQAISAVKPPSTNDADVLLAGIGDFLVRNDIIASSPGRSTYALRQRAAFKQYQEKRPALEPFLQKIAASTGTKGNRYLPQIAFLCAGSLADLLRQRNIFSVSAMLSQIDKIPEALDHAYPDYVASGMFGFVLLNAGKAQL